jgi:hypothetical protein
VSRRRSGLWEPTGTWLAGVLGVVAATTVVAVGFLLVEANDEDDPEGTRAAPTASTRVPTYDVDGDGDADFALIEDQVVTVPSEDDDSGLPVWLPFLGTVLAAVLGGGASVAVAMVNREGGQKLDELADRVDALENGSRHEGRSDDDATTT